MYLPCHKTRNIEGFALNVSFRVGQLKTSTWPGSAVARTAPRHRARWHPASHGLVGFFRFILETADKDWRRNWHPNRRLDATGVNRKLHVPVANAFATTTTSQSPQLRCQTVLSMYSAHLNCAFSSMHCFTPHSLLLISRLIDYQFAIHPPRPCPLPLNRPIMPSAVRSGAACSSPMRHHFTCGHCYACAPLRILLYSLLSNTSPFCHSSEISHDSSPPSPFPVNCSTFLTCLPCSGALAADRSSFQRVAGYSKQLSTLHHSTERPLWPIAQRSSKPPFIAHASLSDLPSHALSSSLSALICSTLP